MTVGILGGGQLGRMLALAGLNLDWRFRVLDPSRSPPAAAAADHVCGEFEDFAALADFVAGLDVITYEFENVPVSAANWLAERVPVYPPPRALAAAQDRVSEKSFFRDLDVPTPPFQPVDSRADFDAGLSAIGRPCVLKTRRFGYDGKGQAVITDDSSADAAWKRLGGRPLILEQYVPFDREVSLLAIRGRDGAVASYPLIENHHRDGVLRRSLAPAPHLPPPLQRLAEAHARRALEALDYVGVLAIEFFQVDGMLLVNEMAPRVHNSGHWTIESAATSQFENHLRAIAGLPLGETRALAPCAMFNLIGSMPSAADVLAVPGARLHNYGKPPRPNRKLGHVTVTAADAADLAQRITILASVTQKSA